MSAPSTPAPPCRSPTLPPSPSNTTSPSASAPPCGRSPRTPASPSPPSTRAPSPEATRGGAPGGEGGEPFHAAIDPIAEKYGATPQQIALAWQLHRTGQALPIPG